MFRLLFLCVWIRTGFTIFLGTFRNALEQTIVLLLVLWLPAHYTVAEIGKLLEMVSLGSSFLMPFR